jgi:hypothetical protein
MNEDITLDRAKWQAELIINAKLRERLRELEEENEKLRKEIGKLQDYIQHRYGKKTTIVMPVSTQN